MLQPIAHAQRKAGGRRLEPGVVGTVAAQLQRQTANSQRRPGVDAVSRGPAVARCLQLRFDLGPVEAKRLERQPDLPWRPGVKPAHALDRQLTLTRRRRDAKHGADVVPHRAVHPLDHHLDATGLSVPEGCEAERCGEERCR